MMSSQHPFPASTLSINVFTETEMFPFQNFNHMLIFVILIRHINTKLLKVAKIGKKLLQTPNVAQRLPSTICLGLIISAAAILKKNFERVPRGIWGE